MKTLVGTKKKPSAVIGAFLVSLLFALLTFTVNVSATTYPDRTEATIFGGHVKATLTYNKDRSPHYTAVGDTITVTTTLEKLDDIPLEEEFNQTSIITLFPDKTQGLALKGEPTFTFTNKKTGMTDQGKFIDPSREIPRNILLFFNLEGKIYYEDTVTYDGRMTEIPVDNSESNDGDYEDTYALYNLLINQGDKVVLSYQSTVTPAALDNKEFSLHTAVYDSSIGDFNADSFLTVRMPTIQQLSVVFDETSKNKQIEVKDADSYKTVLTGTWDGAIEDLHPELTINGKNVSIPDGSFKEDNTFSIPIDLTDIGKIGDNQVHIKISDKNGQLADDDANITLIQTNIPPKLKLSDQIANQTVKVTPATQIFNINGHWQDADSETVSLYYRLNGQKGPLQEGITNQQKNEWTEFSRSIPLNGLHQGENKVEVYAMDSEGAVSNPENVTLDLEPGTVRFKNIVSEILFQALSIAGKTEHSLTQEAVNVLVEDTTTDHNWTLAVQQITPFANNEKVLPASLYYQNGIKNQLLTNNGPITLPTAKENETDYALLQDDTHRFDLTVYPGAYVGEYQSELEWTIVKAP